MDLLEKENYLGGRHPWELSRADSVLSLIESIKSTKIADIGAGDMYFAGKLSEVSNRSVYACDINYSKDECGHHGSIRQIQRIDEIPEESVDLICLLDVLEHVEFEDDFLQQVKSRLQVGGRIVITVPAYQFLFGPHDIFLNHFRRYTKDGLQIVLERNGLEIERIHYFYTSLFILKTIMKIVEKIGPERKYKNEVSNWPHSSDHMLTRTFVSLLNIDFSLNRMIHNLLKTSLPGLSLCAIVKKPA